MLDFLSSKEIC